jgi:hypothetical protein
MLHLFYSKVLPLFMWLLLFSHISYAQIDNDGETNLHSITLSQSNANPCPNTEVKYTATVWESYSVARDCNFYLWEFWLDGVLQGSSRSSANTVSWWWPASGKGTVKVKARECGSYFGLWWSWGNASKDVLIGPAKHSFNIFSNQICLNTPVNYSINPIPNATYYVWGTTNGLTFTDGSTVKTGNFTNVSVIANTAGYGSNITVKAFNNCSESPATTSAFITKGYSNTEIYPANNQICASRTVVFHTLAEKVNSYNWTVPNLWTIVEGQGTSRIVVQTPAIGHNGSVSVATTNSCGLQNYQSRAYVLSNNSGVCASAQPLRISEPKIYPNPAKDILNIEMPDGVKEVILTNSFQEILLQLQTKENNFQIDISKFKQGTYILKIVTETEVIVKQVIFEK